MFEGLKKIPELKSPTFTFAHIPVPHPPFVFDHEGNFTGTTGFVGEYGNHWLPKQAYVDQVLYLNAAVEEVVDSLLTQSETPPIIVIQGDHGPMSHWMRSRETLAILNAYYLPGGGDQYLYPSITPVNSFRLIFDLYFDTQLGLLEDYSYLANYQFKHNLMCKSDNIFPGTSAPALWLANASETLSEHNYHLPVEEMCALEKFLLKDDGLFDLERSGGQYFRWAGSALNLQFPVKETNSAYIFRAGVSHILSNEEQEVLLFVDDQLIDTAIIPPGFNEITFVVPSKQIQKPFVKVQVKHQKIYTDVDPRRLALVYHWIEWIPFNKVQTLPVFYEQDDITADPTIFLGGGWYPLEVEEGKTFRWVNNDAEVIITDPGGKQQELRLEVASGPGLNGGPFELQVLDADGQVVAAAEAPDRGVVDLPLPLTAGEGHIFRLHVEGGGHERTTDNPRILNFRVFSIGWAKPLYEDVRSLKTLNANPDITELEHTRALSEENSLPTDGLLLGPTWYPLEVVNGETFRWVSNDAEIVVTRPSGRQQGLRLEVASGPGLNGGPFELQVLDADGQVVAKAEAPDRGVVDLPLPITAGEGHIFRLHVEDGGREGTANDPRILNFRVFQLAWSSKEDHR